LFAKIRPLALLGAVIAAVLFSAAPGHAAAFDEVAWRRLAARDPLEAIEQVRLRLQIDATSGEKVRLYALLGALLADELGDLQGGIDNYRAALAVDPADPHTDDIRYALALALISTGEYPEASKELAFLLARNPNHPYAFSIRATLEDLKGKPADRKAAPLPRESLLPRIAPRVTAETAVKPPEHGPNIRVLLVRERAVTLESDAVLFLYARDASRLGTAGPTLTCRARDGGVDCGAVRSAVLQVIPAKGATLRVNGRAYRGAVVLRYEGGQLTAVNRLPLESYLYGVLPKEVPYDWPLEALKAQAVAARTYAVSRIALAEGAPYDVEDTVLSQVYGGLAAETPGTTRAVDETRDAILTYGGQPIIAYFHSHSGGRTEDPAHVWGARLPYLVSQDDPYSLETGDMRWGAAYALADVRAKLAAEFPALGEVRSLEVSRKNGPRAELVRVIGSRRSVELSANRLRLLLGPAKLKSTAFRMTVDKRQVRFEGTGYGHGVGLSQWGAMAMARGGADYRKILSFYYRGVNIGPRNLPANHGP
jgi:stage II sporulation protein D